VASSVNLVTAYSPFTSENVSECYEMGNGLPHGDDEIGSKLALLDFLTETQCLLKRST
jgi:hypothetical protein